LLAAAALRLVGTSELALDQPIARWLPNAPQASRITLRQLLQHTSGLRDYGGVRAYHEAVARGDEPWSDEEVCRRAQADELLFEPGHGWRYSNIGYMLVRRLLEGTRKQTLDGVLRAELFAPLGLDGPFVPTRRDQLSTVAFGRTDYFGGLSVHTRYHPNWVMHGVVAATAAEVTALMRALFVGELLPRHALDEMLHMVTIPIDDADRDRAGTPRYGLGVMEMGHDVPVHGHSGGGPGSTAAAYHHGDVTTCALSDADDLDAERWSVAAASGVQQTP
jgi:D-alanyl-D-alanine carboxypeptidase